MLALVVWAEGTSLILVDGIGIRIEDVIQLLNGRKIFREESEIFTIMRQKSTNKKPNTTNQCGEM